MVRLDCPLCGVLVSEGDAPTPGRCTGCGARYEGGTERPQGAVQAALEAFGLEGDAERLTRALFESDPATGVAVTSDRREDFYAWWVFVADTHDAQAQLAHLAR